METVTIRTYESDLAEWKRKANLRGLNLSEWIRRQCNEAQTVNEQVNGDGSTDNKNVLRAAGANPAGRRSGVLGRAGRIRTATGNVQAVDTVRPETTDRGIVRDKRSIAVTRENFAEVMATIKPDEIDSWARLLSPEVLPSHDGTAAAHNKCVCRHCLEKRKTLGIWYGYEPKGKKK